MRSVLMATIGGAAAGVLIATQLAGPLFAQSAEDKAAVYRQLDLFGDIFERVRAEYVEEVDSADLIEAAIQGMLSSLDPHSSYLPPQEFGDMQEQTRGEFGGLGIEVTQEEGYVKVVAPMDDTPAAKAGIQAGDFITHVDGETTLGLSLDKAVEKMRGPVGSEIVITVVREGVAEPFDVRIVRATIKLTAVRARLEGKTVVLRVTTFNDQTYPNLESGLRKAIDEAGGLQEINGVVLDLRNNPGGLLTQAIRVSDAFLDRGDLIEGKPMVVLINGGSASASEIVAGALQDHRRAVVMGTKSFGKGSVQSVIPLRGQAAMRLTTSRYYTPSGRSIQALGVAPDIIVEQPLPRPDAGEADEDETSAAERGRSEADLRGRLENDSMTDEERRLLEEETARAEATAKLREQDYQLAYAIDLLRGLSAMAAE